MQLYVKEIGIAAPGLAGWKEAVPVLRGENSFTPTPLEKYKPGCLPPNEARRATQLVRLAFRAAEDAVSGNAEQAKNLATVFSSSGGDYIIIDQICTVLTQPEHAVSPTQFHNSVHNSAAGYWSIGTGSTLPSNSLSAHDYSFALGLIEAAGMVLVDELDTLLVVYEICPPPRLQKKRPILQEFGSAMTLSRNSVGAVAQLTLEYQPGSEEAEQPLTGWMEFFSSNPAARALPLLEKIARREAGELTLNLPSGPALRVRVTPCY